MECYGYSWADVWDFLTSIDIHPPVANILAMPESQECSVRLCCFYCAGTSHVMIGATLTFFYYSTLDRAGRVMTDAQQTGVSIFPSLIPPLPSNLTLCVNDTAICINSLVKRLCDDMYLGVIHVTIKPIFDQDVILGDTPHAATICTLQR